MLRSYIRATKNETELDTALNRVVVVRFTDDRTCSRGQFDRIKVHGVVKLRSSEDIAGSTDVYTHCLHH